MGRPITLGVRPPKLESEKKPYLRLRNGKQTRSGTTDFNNRFGSFIVGPSIEIANDDVLPGQLTPARQLSQSQRLQLAVLEGALTDVRLGVRRSTHRLTRISQEALSWIDAVDTSWLYSFLNICESLNLEAHAVRRYVHGIVPPLTSDTAEPYIRHFSIYRRHHKWCAVLFNKWRERSRRSYEEEAEAWEDVRKRLVKRGVTGTVHGLFNRQPWTITL